MGTGVADRGSPLTGDPESRRGHGRPRRLVGAIAAMALLVVVPALLLPAPAAGAGRTSMGVGQDSVLAAYDPANQRIYVVDLANFAGGLVHVVNTATESVVATVAVGDLPDSIAYDPANHDMLVTNGGSHNISMINTKNNTIDRTLTVSNTLEPVAAVYDPVTRGIFVLDYATPNCELSFFYPPRYTGFSFALSGDTWCVAQDGGGLAVDPANGELYIADQAYGTVLAMDTSTLTVVANISVGATGYQQIAYDPVYQFVYVALGSNVTLIDSGTDIAAASVSLPKSLCLSYAIVYDPLDRLMDTSYFCNGYTGGEIFEINTSTAQVTAERSSSLVSSLTYDSANHDLYWMSGSSLSWTSVQSYAPLVTLGLSGAATGMAIDPASHRLFISDGVHSNVTVIDTATRGIVAHVAVGSLPVGMDFDPGNGCVYVADYSSDLVSVLNGSTGTVVASVAVGSHPYGVVYDSADGFVYVTNSGSLNVSVINGSSNTVVKTLAVGSGPGPIAFDPDTAEVYVVDTGGPNVTILQGLGYSSTPSATPATQPISVAYDPATRDMYFGDASSGSVRVYNPQFHRLLGNIGLYTGASPDGLQYDPGNRNLAVASSELGVEWLSTASRETASSAVSANSAQMVYDPLTGDLIVAGALIGPGGPIGGVLTWVAS